MFEVNDPLGPLPNELRVHIWTLITVTPKTFAQLRSVSRCTSKYVLLYCNLFAVRNKMLHWLVKHGYIDALRIVAKNPTVVLDNDLVLISSAANKMNTLVFLLDELKLSPTQGALRSSVSAGHRDIVRVLIEHGISPALLENRAIIDACGYGFYDTAKVLLSDSRVDPSAQRNAALIRASGNGSTEIVKLLLSDSRVDPNARNGEPLCLAIMNGHTSTVRLLLDNPRVNRSGSIMSSLYSAQSKGFTEIVEMINNDPRFSK